MTERQELSSEETESRSLDDFSPSRELLPPAQRKKKSRNSNKRRFSDEQVRSLETIFESETKLDPRKKVQVARELGLQPRQVAIWFQNKRARWKSKQIEKEFKILKAKFDHLKERFESTREEKESLLSQLQELNNVLHKTQDGSNRSCRDSAENSLHKDQPHEDNQKVAADFEPETIAADEEELDPRAVIYSDNDESGHIASLGQEEPELVNIDEHIISGAFVPPVKWCSFDSGNFFDHPNNTSYWWDSWT